MRTIYYNGAVYTGDSAPGSGLRRGGRTVLFFAGSDEEAVALKREGDRLVDLQGRLCVQRL